MWNGQNNMNKMITLKIFALLRRRYPYYYQYFMFDRFSTSILSVDTTTSIFKTLGGTHPFFNT